MSKSIATAVIILTSLMVVGCAMMNDKKASLHLSQQYYPFLQPSFTGYLEVTEKWLSEHRSFISKDFKRELAMNMPFELGSRSSDRAVLLVHGLGDSPYSFSDIAMTFVEQGFYVQVLLLPGHGSKPEDMQLATYEDWQSIVDHYANLLKQSHKEIWLGGFSTGANLVSIHAMNNQDIAGLVMFSPGFKSKSPIFEKFNAFASFFWDGIAQPEDNLAKYNSLPLQGMAEYSKSAAVFREGIAQQNINIPTLIALSEADSIIDAQAVTELFSNKFLHPRNKLIWYGDRDNLSHTNKIDSYSMRLEGLKISTASHMSPLFNATNSYYGKKAQKIICVNNLNKKHTESCKKGGPIWFSAWGHTEKDKIFARLTWNPYFNHLNNEIEKLTAN